MIAKSFAAFALLFSSLAYAEDLGTAPVPADEQEPVAVEVQSAPLLLQSRSGFCAGQPAGSCFQLNTTPPVTIMVGAGGDANPEPPPPPPPPPQASCPADDGSANAPQGTPQHPTLLARYDASRTIHALGCKIPGVDYYVGPTGSLNPPSSINTPGVRVSGNLVRCDAANAPNIDAVISNIDFTGWVVFIPASGGCRSLTIENSRFGCGTGPSGSYTGGPQQFAFINIQGPSNFTLRRSRVDTFTGCGAVYRQVVSDPVTCNFGTGSCTIEYNWFFKLRERAVTGGCGRITYRYNLIDEPQPPAEVHQNFLQQGCNGGGSHQGVTIQFNTTYQAVLGGAEGWQFNSHANQIFQYNGPISLEYNTMIALRINNTPSMSNIVHGFCHTIPNCNQTAQRVNGTARIANNFFDPTGAFNAFFPGRGTAMWPAAVVFDRNINMTTGATLLPPT